MKSKVLFFMFMLLPVIVVAAESSKHSFAAGQEYVIGVEDILNISILQPDAMTFTVTVTPDGAITFPYIGKVAVNEKTSSAVQEEIQTRLANGYLKYPLVSVAVKECRSKKFYVYGEVEKPGTYFLEDKMTVLKAISNAGGLTKYGSLNRIHILRRKKDADRYETAKVNMDSVLNGSTRDIVLEPGDIIQIKEGIF